MVDLDTEWKFKALELAHREFLELEGEIKSLDRLFDRTRQIYDMGHKNGLFNWKSPWKDTSKRTEKPEEIKEPKKPEKIKLTKDGKRKICPKCKDEVPLLFKVHHTGTKGACGYRFQD